LQNLVAKESEEETLKNSKWNVQKYEFFEVEKR